MAEALGERTGSTGRSDRLHEKRGKTTARNTLAHNIPTAPSQNAMCEAMRGAVLLQKLLMICKQITYFEFVRKLVFDFKWME